LPIDFSFDCATRIWRAIPKRPCCSLTELLSIPDNDRPCFGAAKAEPLSKSSIKVRSATGRMYAREQPATVCVALRSSSDSMGHRHAGSKKSCSRPASPDSECLYRLAARSSCRPMFLVRVFRRQPSARKLTSVSSTNLRYSLRG
jgi:hypothetical protein